MSPARPPTVSDLAPSSPAGSPTSRAAAVPEAEAGAEASTETPAFPRPTRERPYVHEVEVRYAETDQMGVVHHANYLLYLEDARTLMLRHCAMPYSEVEKAGIGLPVRNATLKYMASGLFEDVLLISCWIERTRAASVTFGYEVHRKEDGQRGTHLLSAEVELACMDLETRKPRVFPAMLKSFFIVPNAE